MAIINKEFYKKLDDAIDTIPSRDEAEKFINQVFEAVQQQAEDMLEKVYQPIKTKIDPYLFYFELIMELISPPTSIDDVIDYCKKIAKSFEAYIRVIRGEIQPYLKMYDNMRVFLIETPLEIAYLQIHIQEKLKQKGWEDLVIPVIVIPPIPELPPIPDILKEDGDETSTES